MSRCPDCKQKMDHCINCDTDYCISCEGIHECENKKGVDLEEDSDE